MFSKNLITAAKMQREETLRDAAKERMLHESGVLKSLGIGGFLADTAKKIRSYFSRSTNTVRENQRDLTPCPECA
jgi:hypothetical protein